MKKEKPTRLLSVEYSHLNNEFAWCALILSCSSAVSHLTNAARHSQMLCIRSTSYNVIADQQR